MLKVTFLDSEPSSTPGCAPSFVPHRESNFSRTSEITHRPIFSASECFTRLKTDLLLELELRRSTNKTPPIGPQVLQSETKLWSREFEPKRYLDLLSDEVFVLYYHFHLECLNLGPKI